jgi:hypothetical protein
MFKLERKTENRKTDEKRKEQDLVLHRRSRGQSELTGALRIRERKKTSLLISCCGDTSEALNGLVQKITKTRSNERRGTRYARNEHNERQIGFASKGSISLVFQYVQVQVK